MTEERRSSTGEDGGDADRAPARDRRQHASLDAAPELFDIGAEPDASC